MIRCHSHKECMITSHCLLSCALMLAQPSSAPPDRADWLLTPQLSPGLELVYRGSYMEESLIPGVQQQKQFRLDANLLVLDVKCKEWQGAFMTVLSMQEPAANTVRREGSGPMSVRLELARIDAQGNVS